MMNNFSKTPFTFVMHFVAKQWIKFSLLALISIIWASNDALFPYFLKRIVNILQHWHGTPSEIYHAVSVFLLLLVGFWAITEIMMRLQGILQIYAFSEFRTTIRNTVFNYVNQHSYQYFSNHFSGDLAKKIADLPTSCQTIVEIATMQFITATAGSILVTIMMWYTKPILAVVVLIWLVLHLGLTILFLHRINSRWQQYSDSVSILSGNIVDVFTNILNVRLFARSRYESSYLRKFENDEIKKLKKARWSMEFVRMGLGISGLFLIFSSTFLLLYGYAHSWISLGDFTQVEMQIFWLLGWIWYVSYQLMLFLRETGAISNALTVVTENHDIVDIKDAPDLNIKKGEIQFNDVSFFYQKQRWIFKDLTLTIPAGKKVGLVGFSGSGKTSLVNLILRFFDIQKGEILIDGQNIAKITQNSLRTQIAMIPQDPTLFHRSLLENIRYGKLDASDGEVIAAAKKAHCHEFIEVLDDKYQAIVGERGIKLSGGQRQRIAIARAILKNAPILILDEATSALDSVTEKLIQESLHEIMMNRTTIVIAHRLSTLQDMDIIFVFDEGKVVEIGNKEQLLTINGYFAKLWQMQINGFLPEIEKQ